MSDTTNIRTTIVDGFHVIMTEDVISMLRSAEVNGTSYDCLAFQLQEFKKLDEEEFANDPRVFQSPQES